MLASNHQLIEDHGEDEEEKQFYKKEEEIERKDEADENLSDILLDEDENDKDFPNQHRYQVYEMNNLFQAEDRNGIDVDPFHQRSLNQLPFERINFSSDELDHSSGDSESEEGENHTNKNDISMDFENNNGAAEQIQFRHRSLMNLASFTDGDLVASNNKLGEDQPRIIQIIGEKFEKNMKFFKVLWSDDRISIEDVDCVNDYKDLKNEYELQVNQFLNKCHINRINQRETVSFFQRKKKKICNENKRKRISDINKKKYRLKKQLEQIERERQKIEDQAFNKESDAPVLEAEEAAVMIQNIEELPKQESEDGNQALSNESSAKRSKRQFQRRKNKELIDLTEQAKANHIETNENTENTYNTRHHQKRHEVLADSKINTRNNSSSNSNSRSRSRSGTKKQTKKQQQQNELFTPSKRTLRSSTRSRQSSGSSVVSNKKKNNNNNNRKATLDSNLSERSTDVSKQNTEQILSQNFDQSQCDQPKDGQVLAPCSQEQEDKSHLMEQDYPQLSYGNQHLEELANFSPNHSFQYEREENIFYPQQEFGEEIQNSYAVQQEAYDQQELQGEEQLIPQDNYQQIDEAQQDEQLAGHQQEEEANNLNQEQDNYPVMNANQYQEIQNQELSELKLSFNPEIIKENSLEKEENRMAEEHVEELSDSCESSLEQNIDKDIKSEHNEDKVIDNNIKTTKSKRKYQQRTKKSHRQPIENKWFDKIYCSKCKEFLSEAEKEMILENIKSMSQYQKNKYLNDYKCKGVCVTIQKETSFDEVFNSELFEIDIEVDVEDSVKIQEAIIID